MQEQRTQQSEDLKAILGLGHEAFADTLAAFILKMADELKTDADKTADTSSSRP